MYGAHSYVPDLHASYERAVVKIYRKAAISLFTCETQEWPSLMQGCTLPSVLFLRREEKNQKKHPPPLNLTFGRLLSRLGRVQVELASPLAVPSVPPIWGRLNRSSCRSYIKVRSDHPLDLWSLIWAKRVLRKVWRDLFLAALRCFGGLGECSKV